MKFISYCYNGEENVGIFNNDRIIPLNINLRLNTNSMIDLIERMNERMIENIKHIIDAQDYKYLPADSVRLLAPIPYPKRNVFCLGKNYEEHVREIINPIANKDIPKHPIYFTKTAAPAVAHGDLIKFSRQITKQVDYEVELAVIIGKEGININSKEAEDYVFGYTIVNDVSARDLQAKHQQWHKGKSLDYFCPMGPWIVSKEEIPFSVELDIQCSINGELRQASNTRNMIFDIPYIISDLSKGMTLKPGDIICTGTPSGVGMGFDPPKFLNDGDTIECYIEKVGKLVNRVSVSC
jgi:2-keto-4-pentenoate hydratase/2-oxohepta-3-ene-1,7-dioic acid hydratase in catechol pathway